MRSARDLRDSPRTPADRLLRDAAREGGTGGAVGRWLGREHAYPPATTHGTVELTLWTESDHLCVEVVDRGIWREPPTATGERGFGLVLMRCLVESLLVHHDAHGTCVLLRHPLPNPASAPARAWQRRTERPDEDRTAPPDLRPDRVAPDSDDADGSMS